MEQLEISLFSILRVHRPLKVVEEKKGGQRREREISYVCNKKTDKRTSGDGEGVTVPRKKK